MKMKKVRKALGDAEIQRIAHKGLYEDPITLTRNQLAVAWDAIRVAVDSLESTIASHAPQAGHDPTQDDEAVISEAEEILRPIRRLQFTLRARVRQP